MAVIHQHDALSIDVVGDPVAAGLVPGQLCCHVEDRRSLGVVIAADVGTATVLWSRPPVGALDMMRIQTQEITAASRKLRVGWTITERDGPNVVGNFSFEGAKK